MTTIENICLVLKPNRIAYYVDSFITPLQLSESELFELFKVAFEKVIKDLNDRLQKYEKFNIYDIFSFNDREILPEWHVQYIQSLIYTRCELSNKLILTFYRDNKEKNGIEKVTYKN